MTALTLQHYLSPSTAGHHGHGLVALAAMIQHTGFYKFYDDWHIFCPPGWCSLLVLLIHSAAPSQMALCCGSLGPSLQLLPAPAYLHRSLWASSPFSSLGFVFLGLGLTSFFLLWRYCYPSVVSFCSVICIDPVLLLLIFPCWGAWTCRGVPALGEMRPG